MSPAIYTAAAVGGLALITGYIVGLNAKCDGAPKRVRQFILGILSLWALVYAVGQILGE